MNRGAVLGIFAAVVSWQALAEGVLPRDVARFVTARDRCDHFRGEYPYDEERRRFLDKNMRTYCVGTDKQLAALKDQGILTEEEFAASKAKILGI